MDVKHRKETSVGWLRIMLTTLILIFAVPFSRCLPTNPKWNPELWEKLLTLP